MQFWSLLSHTLWWVVLAPNSIFGMWSYRSWVSLACQFSSKPVWPTLQNYCSWLGLELKYLCIKRLWTGGLCWAQIDLPLSHRPWFVLCPSFLLHIISLDACAFLPAYVAPAYCKSREGSWEEACQECLDKLSSEKGLVRSPGPWISAFPKPLPFASQLPSLGSAFSAAVICAATVRDFSCFCFYSLISLIWLLLLIIFQSCVAALLCLFEFPSTRSPLHSFDVETDVDPVDGKSDINVAFVISLGDFRHNCFFSTWMIAGLNRYILNMVTVQLTS